MGVLLSLVHLECFLCLSSWLLPFTPFCLGEKHRPPTGAIAGRYDSAEFESSFGYDPDNSSLLSCNQIPPQGYNNIDFYCNHALDALYQQELTTVDPGLRQQIFDQIHSIYLTVLTFIVLTARQTSRWYARERITTRSVPLAEKSTLSGGTTVGSVRRFCSSPSRGS